MRSIFRGIEAAVTTGSGNAGLAMAFVLALSCAAHSAAVAQGHPGGGAAALGVPASGTGALGEIDDCDTPAPASTTQPLLRPIACSYTTPRGSFGATTPTEPIKPPVVAIDDTGKKAGPGSGEPAKALKGGFAYFPPGSLVAQDQGRGRTGDRKVYLPGIVFPLKLAGGMDRNPAGRHAHMNSQIWGYGGGGWNGRGAAGGTECDARNYEPMVQRDNFCEVRGWDMPMCPGGAGHQGQDIRPPACDDNKWDAVAVVDGIITQVTSNTTVRLKGGDGTEYYYLHMHPDSITVEEGAVVKQGQVLGRVSNFMNGSRDTTHHLHFQVKQSVTIGTSVQRVYVPVFASLIAAYRVAKGMDRGVDDKGNLLPDPGYEIGAKPIDDPTRPPFTLWPVVNVAGDDGKPIEPINLARAFRPVDEKAKLTFAATGLPDGLSVDVATGIISGKLKLGAARGGTGGVYTVAAKVTDAVGRSASQSFTITASNKAPIVVAPTTAKTFREGDTVLIAAGSAFADPNLDTLTFTATGLPDYLAIDPASGRISGVLALGTAAAKPSGVYAIVVTARDGQGNATSETFALTALEEKKPAPLAILPPLVLSPLPQITAVAGEDLPVIETAGAFKPPVGSTTPLRFSASGLPAGIAIDAATGQIKGTLAANAAENGDIYPVVVTASTSEGGTVSQTLLITATNRSPKVVTQTVNKTYLEGDTVLISAGSAFTAAADIALVYTAIGLPSGVMIDPKQGTITGRLAAGTAAGGPAGGGIYTVAVTARDRRGASATETFTLAVAVPPPPPMPPIVTGTLAAVTVKDGEMIAPVDVSRVFKPGQGAGPLVYGAAGLPQGLAIDAANGVIGGTVAPNASQAAIGGNYAVVVSARDAASGLSAATGFVLTATGQPAPAPAPVVPPPAVKPPSEPAASPPAQVPVSTPSAPQPAPQQPAAQGWWPWFTGKVSGLWNWGGKK